MSENERTTSHETVDAFNDTCPVGTPVLAFPGSREGRALMTRTRSVAWSLGHEPVVMVEGYAGGIALTHVEVLPTNESAPDPTSGEHGCRWSASRGRWETVLWPGVSKEACGHLSHTRGDEMYLPDEAPRLATPDADDARCTCANDGNASRCPLHTQADYDASASADDASECEDGVFGTQDIANALGGRGPDASAETSEPLSEAERRSMKCRCDGSKHARICLVPAVERIKAAAATKARADERERIAQAIESEQKQRLWPRILDFGDGMLRAARIARGDA